MPNPPTTFLSCDWGTTSFRIRLVQGCILKEYSDANGCRSLYEANTNPPARREAFEAHLRKVLGPWENSGLQSHPLVISGMASSTIGWQEVPYAPLPLALNGLNVRVESIAWNAPPLVRETLLVSGAASESEMMRGEESEAIGLLNSRPPTSEHATLILPGTHSKHLSVEGGAITDIRTFMTGELFDVLSGHSVLRASVDPSAPIEQDAFKAGLDRARSHGLAGSLFQTRTRQVLQKKSPESNASFLSGLLIGTELSDLLPTTHILIAGANPLRNLYAQAARHFGLNPAHVFSSDEVQLAVPIAHELILSRFLNS